MLLSYMRYLKILEIFICEWNYALVVNFLIEYQILVRYPKVTQDIYFW